MDRLIIILALATAACAPTLKKETMHTITEVQADADRINVAIDTLQLKVVELELRIQQLEEKSENKGDKDDKKDKQRVCCPVKGR